MKNILSLLWHNNGVTHPVRYRLSMLTDKLMDRKNKKAKEQFKAQIQHMASKPSFTYMDYKQRIIDEISKLQKGVKAKFSSEHGQAQKKLSEQLKILNALFEQELVQQKPIKGEQKKQISMVTQTPIQKVNEVIKKVKQYKKMHSLLRGMKERNQQLPQDMETLNYAYLKSGIEHTDPNTKYLKYEKRSRIVRSRFIKYKKM